MKILFIDDQPDVRDIMSMILTDELNAKVECFSNSNDASTYLEENSEEISLIICDYKLPEESGIEFYEKIKTRKIPFILLTGMFFQGENEQVNSFIEGERNKLVYKPVDEDALIKEIRTIV